MPMTSMYVHNVWVDLLSPHQTYAKLALYVVLDVLVASVVLDVLAVLTECTSIKISSASLTALAHVKLVQLPMHSHALHVS